jgi:hypothetical protein
VDRLPRTSDVAAVDAVREAIRVYIDHLQDGAYVSAIFNKVNTSTVLALLADMLRGGERNDVGHGLLFTEDAILFRLAPPEFADEYVASDLLEVVRAQIYAPDYSVRHLAVHALSRLGPRDNAAYLADALPWYLAHDPLNLDGLLMELRVLHHKKSWRAHLEAMAVAPLYLTRWAAVEVLWERGAQPVIGVQAGNGVWARQLLRGLAQDHHPLVRREARWRLDQERASKPRRPLPRWHRRLQATRLRQGEPRPTYFKLWLSVGDYLAVSGEPDYDVALVGAIIDHLRAHPIASGYDIHAYWRPLADARGVPM